MTERVSHWTIASKRVVLGAGDALVITPACITMQGSTIASVQRIRDEDYEATLDQMDGDVTDCGEQLITPAFVNAHTHLALGFLRGFDLRAASRGNMVEEFFYAVEAALSPEDIAAFARMGAYESLLHGVGLVWDHYYAGEQIAAALADVGLSGVVAPTLQDLAGPGKDSHERQLEVTAQIDDDLDLRARGVFAAYGPHATDTVSEALWKRCLSHAQQRNLPLHAHLSQSPVEVRRARRRHGSSPVAWLQRLGVFEAVPSGVWAHGIYASSAELQHLTAGSNMLVWCPASAFVFGLAARVGAWSQAGVDWAVGTDCASNNDGMNVQAELRLIAAQRTLGATWSPRYQALLDGDDDVDGVWQRRTELFSEHEPLAAPMAMLQRVWSMPGAAHPGFRAGVITPGALANLLVWDLDHPALWPALDPLHTLAMADATKAIATMVVAGRVVGDQGDLHGSILRSDDFAQARREANDRLAAVLEHVADHAG